METSIRRHTGDMDGRHLVDNSKTWRNSLPSPPPTKTPFRPEIGPDVDRVYMNLDVEFMIPAICDDKRISFVNFFCAIYAAHVVGDRVAARLELRHPM